MNSDVPSSEHELTQDGSSESSTNEIPVNSSSSQQLNDSAENFDTAKSDSDFDNDSNNQTSDESSTISDANIKGSDTEARLEQLEKEHETLNSQYMRIAADFDNFRKRQTRDQDDLKIQLTCTTLSEILPVVDNFERARQQLNPEGEEAQALHRNYQVA